MTPVFRIFVQYALPPLLGALIGYVTNKIAIQMLFRPHRPKHIAGVRIPFTPGVLPRKRKEFSRSLARLVGEKLLTAEVLIDHLRNLSEKPDIIRKSQRLFSSDFWKKDNLQPYEAQIQAAMHTATQWVQRHSHQVEDAVSDYLASFMLSPKMAETLHTVISDLAEELLAPHIRDFLEQMTVADLGRKASVDLWHTALSKLGYAFCRWLQQEEMYADLVRVGKRILRKIVDELSVIRRIIITGSRYLEELEENMPSTVHLCINELRTFLSDPATAKLLREKLPSEKSIAQWMRSHNLDAGAISRGVARTTAQFLSSHVTSRHLGELLSPETIRSLIRRGITWVVEAPREKLYHAAIALISRWMKAFGEEKDGRRIRDYVMKMVETFFPPLWSFLDIPTIVQRWVDRLPMEQTEHLLLELISRHLRWINIFGAFLGALIGGLQVLLRVMLP